MTQWGIDTLFNPAKRHMDEEKRRLQSTREEVGDASGGKRIDFEKGKVVIRREAGEETGHGNGDESTPAGDGTESQETAKTAKSSKSADKPLSAAAIRAAKRRGRDPR